jgi:hypothetical protein
LEAYKLHIKIGAHEFRGEGPEESVRRDFEEWKAFMASLPVSMLEKSYDSTSASNGASSGGLNVAGDLTDERLDRIYVVDTKQRLISLRVHPRTADRNRDAILLILFGYSRKFGQDAVAVGQIKQAMRQTGIKIERVDKVAAKYIDEGYLNKGGIGKGSRYSLTNSGIAKVYELLEAGT